MFVRSEFQCGLGLSFAKMFVIFVRGNVRISLVGAIFAFTKNRVINENVVMSCSGLVRTSGCNTHAG